MLGVSVDAYSNDPLILAPALQNYVSRLPLDEFEQSDWATLHSDLMAYVADFLIHQHGAQWLVVDDTTTPRGFRYVIEASGRDDETRRIDPLDVVMAEFHNLPVDIIRMLASAELTLRLSSRIADDE